MKIIINIQKPLVARLKEYDGPVYTSDIVDLVLHDLELKVKSWEWENGKSKKSGGEALYDEEKGILVVNPSIYNRVIVELNE